MGEQIRFMAKLEMAFYPGEHVHVWPGAVSVVKPRLNHKEIVPGVSTVVLQRGGTLLVKGTPEEVASTLDRKRHEVFAFRDGEVGP